MNYDDGYPTCAETYATLRIYDAEPAAVSALLEVEPSSIQRIGQPTNHRGKVATRHAWFLTTNGKTTSLDSRRHIDDLLVPMMEKRDLLEQLRVEGAQIDLVCYWRSSQGHGGPTLSPTQSIALVALGLDLWYDFYSE
jgi:hypothetical protein